MIRNIQYLTHIPQEETPDPSPKVSEGVSFFVRVWGSLGYLILASVGAILERFVLFFSGTICGFFPFSRVAFRAEIVEICGFFQTWSIHHVWHLHPKLGGTEVEDIHTCI